MRRIFYIFVALVFLVCGGLVLTFAIGYVAGTSKEEAIKTAQEAVRANDRWATPYANHYEANRRWYGWLVRVRLTQSYYTKDARHSFTPAQYRLVRLDSYGKIISYRKAEPSEDRTFSLE
jgi:hypothetical protein